MIRIGDTVVSLDLLRERFRCDLEACNGNCCRYGDAGAPLTDEEATIIDEVFHEIEPYLRPEGAEAIREQGTSIRDVEGELVTPLIDDQECAYTYLSGDILLCSIEKAWSEDRISLRKPMSCHLFPVRIKSFSDFTAVNYEEWSICRGGRAAGTIEDVKVFSFLREPLIRAFGQNWYDELEVVSRELPGSGVADI